MAEQLLLAGLNALKRTCLAFAIDLAKGNCHLEECPILDQPEFTADREALVKLLE